MVCASCPASLKGIPLTHGTPVESRPRGGLLTIMAVMLCGLVEQTAMGIGLGMIMAALTVVLAGLAAAPLRPLDEDRQWGTSALYVLLFILVIMVVMAPVICLGVLYSLIR
jgi:hypothetical protein